MHYNIFINYLQIYESPVALHCEFMHMTTNHMQNEKNPMTLIAPADKPSIKIRRLSGDTLSISSARIDNPIPTTALNKASTKAINKEQPLTQICTTLKITNVVSLGEQSRNAASVSGQFALPKQQPIVNSSRNVLKPWSKLPCIKSMDICTTMLANLSLYSLFKCMAAECQFSNSSAETMIQHLRYHVMRTLVPPMTKASWLECAYCDDSFGKIDMLVKHVITEHSTSIFQCPYCFYRACAAHNVLLHIKNMHSSTEPLVLVCRGKAKMLTSDLPAIFEARDINVKPIKCSKGTYKYYPNNNK